MQKIRIIARVFAARPTVEGAGVHLKRALGYAQAPRLDPFLLLDDFHSNRPSEYLPGFPWHPHRGIETVTYVLHGKVEHGDSMGNRGVIGEGDVQWMTAGSGIIHQEMPRGDEKNLLWGFQLWANLPASHKMMDPRYRGITREEIPEVITGEGARVKVIAGEEGGIQGPVQGIVTDPSYLDITVLPGKTYRRSVPAGHTVAAYVIQGSGSFDPRDDPFGYVVEGDTYFTDLRKGPGIEKEHLVLYGDGDEVMVEAGPEGVRFLLFSGKPVGEPVAWYGPIVMNTQEELKVAFDELDKGTFIKKPGNRPGER
ncbi:redox-sensitive bicupin YhaK (pirin superfamily) [Methanolinea mesophila]|nr:redox-sensitive bicupin YhaK (pirin superfamily) [Methanolinea mesophila]